MEREGRGEDEGGSVSQLNEGREGRAAVLYIPLTLQAAELGSAGHASPPAWTLPIVEVIVAAGQEREAHTGKEAQR